MASGDTRPVSKLPSGTAWRSRSIQPSRSVGCSTRRETGGGCIAESRNARAPSDERAPSSPWRIHAGVDSMTARSRKLSSVEAASVAIFRSTAFAKAPTRGPRANLTDSTASLTAAKAGTRVKNS